MTLKNCFFDLTGCLNIERSNSFLKLKEAGRLDYLRNGGRISQKGSVL